MRSSGVGTIDSFGTGVGGFDLFSVGVMCTSGFVDGGDEVGGMDCYRF
jgi:hypothetical protein